MVKRKIYRKGEKYHSIEEIKLKCAIFMRFYFVYSMFLTYFCLN